MSIGVIQLSPGLSALGLSIVGVGVCFAIVAQCLQGGRLFSGTAVSKDDHVVHAHSFWVELFEFNAGANVSKLDQHSIQPRLRR